MLPIDVCMMLYIQHKHDMRVQSMKSAYIKKGNCLSTSACHDLEHVWVHEAHLHDTVQQRMHPRT